MDMFNWIMMTMPKPPVFGTFHLCFIAGTVVLAALLLIFLRKCSDKTFRIIVGTAWVIIFVLEIAKEFIWSHAGGAFAYDWNSFPYQFCSLPFYVWPLVALLPESRHRDAINIFAGTFMFFAGFAYMFVASSLCSYVIINIQTLLHHGLMASIGLFIFIHENNKITFKKFLQSISYLVMAVALAIILNVVITKTGHGCNLFELNPLPGHETGAAVFKDILGATNYPVYVLIYIVGFTIFAGICYFVIKGIIGLAARSRKA